MTESSSSSSSSATVYDYPVDPYSLVLDRLWAVLEADARFNSLVALRSRVKQPEALDVVAEADRPLVEITPSGGQSEIGHTVNFNRCTQRFLIRCVSGDVLPKNMLFPLKWAVTSALSRAGVSMGLPGLVWDVTVDDVRDDLRAAEDTQRAAFGWSNAIQVTVLMMLSISAT